MKGVVLAGGTGSRLNPLTRVTNKHLLPVYDKPMVYYPIQTLVNAGIQEILLVTGGKNAGEFLRLLGNGRDFGLKHINYTYQEGEGGIAEALGLAEHFADGEPICVILGDNIIENNVLHDVENLPWLASATKGRPLIARLVVPISTEEFHSPTPRPAYSVLSNARLKQVFGVALPDWRTQLQRCFSPQRTPANPPAAFSSC